MKTKKITKTNKSTKTSKLTKTKKQQPLPVEKVKRSVKESQVAIVPQEQAPQEQKKVDLSKVHLHVGIPCYGGQLTEPCFNSFLRFVLTAPKVGMAWSLDTMVNESLVTRARNNLISKMLANEAATHFMFIDADIRFAPEYIFEMLMSDKDVIGGLYPKKSLPIDYVINKTANPKVDGKFFTVDKIGTGFLIMKRHVIEKMIQKFPETKYKDSMGIGEKYEKHMYALFDTIISNGIYLSEDWTFCERWIGIGGEVWAHSGAVLNHVGHYEFNGDPNKLKV